MKILVLGESATSGDRNDGVSWTSIFGDLLAEASDEPVTIEHTNFIPTGERAPGIAGKRVADHEPDLVVMPVGAWVFSSKFVWLRVQRLFGKRAGRWFRRIEESVDSVTYDRGRIRGGLNRALRKTAHTVLGAEAITTHEESEGVYDETFTRLAREERIEVLLVPYARNRRIFKDPKFAAERDLYMDAVRAAAERRHFLWVETEPAFANLEDREGTVEADGLHANLKGQQIIGEYVAAAYLEHAKQRATD